MAAPTEPSKFSPHDRVVICGADGCDKVPLHQNGPNTPATMDMEVGVECQVQVDEGGDMVQVRFTAQKWRDLNSWTMRQHLKPSSKGWVKVDDPTSSPALEAPAVARTTGPLERFVVPAMSALQRLNPKDRPGTKEKLATWLKRGGFCVVREDNVVSMHLLIPEILKIQGAGPVSDVLQTLAGEPVERAVLPAEVVAESALRCVNRLKHQTDFLKWPLDRRDKWMKSQGYASFRVESQVLAAELERLGAAKVGASPQQLTYDEDVLRAPAEGGGYVTLPKTASAMCKTFSVGYLAPNLKACMTKDERKRFKKWLKILGCRLSPTHAPSVYQVTIMAGLARHSTSVAVAQELERQVQKELPEVLKYILGDPNQPSDSRVINTKVDWPRRMKGFVIGKKGESIKELESKYQVRLTYISQERFTGWLSTSLLPDDGTAEGLRGLGERLKLHAKTAQVAVDSHISRVVQQCNAEDSVYRAEKAKAQKLREAQLKAMSSTPLKEGGSYGAAQLDRDHARETDVRKKAQRKQALLARESRQHHWKKRRDHMDQQRGGRHKSGEGHVGQEDRADAGQGSSGVAKDLRPLWEDPVDPGFTSQLDSLGPPKVPGSRPQHRGHKPGNLREPFDPSARPVPKRKPVQRGYSAIYEEGLGVDSSTEEDD